MNIDLILVDVNAIGYACMYQPDLARLSHRGQSTSALTGAPISVLSLMDRFPSAIPVVLWDGSASWRKTIFPGYKANRKSTPEKLAIRADYARQSVVLRQIFSALGIPQVFDKEAEADDLAGQIIDRLPSPISMIMATKDTDWWQGLRQNVQMFSTLSKQLITLDTIGSDQVKDGPFDSVEQYVVAKAIAGDLSDEIDGVPRVGIPTALKILRRYGSLQGIYSAVDAGLAKKDNTAIKIASCRDLIARNACLVDWNESPVISEQVSVWANQPDRIELQHLATAYGLKRLPFLSSKFTLDPRKVSSAVNLVDGCFRLRPQ